MALDQQVRISHYVIQSRLGAGGMGEVYKGLDTRLDRPVALKVLAAHLVEDPDKVQRFVQEAKAASALNHPNIVTIYEIGSASPVEPVPDSRSHGPDAPALTVEPPASSTNGNSQPVIDFIAMEFVDGTTLGEKIHSEKCHVRKLIEYLAQAADGLAKAHASGIVHRDLKPDNIMVSRDGYAKILDFGLAKLVEQKGAADDQAETAMMHTQPGVVMGTAGYMSPEQVQGKAVDQRSDIFAFGCVLYEAATGRRAFEGESIIDSLHKILYSQAPPVRDSNPGAPAELQRIIRKCLSKSPDERYQSARELAIDLRDLLREYDSGAIETGDTRVRPATGEQPDHPDSTPTLISGPLAASASAPPLTGPAAASGRQARAAIMVIAAWVIIVIAVLAYVFFGPQRTKTPVIGSFQTGGITRLTGTGKALLAAISPDGKYAAHAVAEAGQQSLWIRQVATSSNIQIVPPQDIRYTGITFSHDGNYVYYCTRDKGKLIGELYRIPALGGAAKKLISDIDSPISFAPDGKRVAFVRNQPEAHESNLMLADADGSGEQKVATIAMPDQLIAPAWSPDGTVVACSKMAFDGGYHYAVAAFQVSGGSERQVSTQRWRIVTGLAWLLDGKGLVISAAEQNPGLSRAQIWQVTYPDGKLSRITNDLSSYSGVSLTADGSALVTTETDTISNLWNVPAAEAARAVQITSGSSVYSVPAWTPDGRIVYASNAGGNQDIWIMDSDGRNQKQLTAEAGFNTFPQVSPDGKYIVFNSNRGGDWGNPDVWLMEVDGGHQTRLTSGRGEHFPYPSPDGKWVLYNPQDETGRKPSLWKVPLTGGDPVLIREGFLLAPIASPDGKYAAVLHQPEPNTPFRLAVIPLDGGGPIAQFEIEMATFDGPTYRWSADSKGLLYLRHQAGVSNIWYQPVPSGAARQITDFKNDHIFFFDRSTDGKQFVCARGVTTTDVVLVRNQEPAAGR